MLGVEVAENFDGRANEFHDDKVVHERFQKGASDVGSGNIPRFESLDDDGDHQSIG
jgi:hypothetical protein